MVSESLVRSCLYNWLGYGNLNGEVWFIGTEEGGAEIWGKTRTKSLEESLMLRSRFNLAMDFRNVWEDIYNIPLEKYKDKAVWRYLAAFLLSYHGEKVRSDTIQRYVFSEKLLGRNDSSHFLGELLPLPKPRDDFKMFEYKHIWGNTTHYHRDVLPKRFNLIKETLLKNSGAKIIVSYCKKCSDEFFKRFNFREITRFPYIPSDEKKAQNYNLYSTFIEKRQVYLLTTPFFGNGGSSYSGLAQAAKGVRDILTR